MLISLSFGLWPWWNSLSSHLCHPPWCSGWPFSWLSFLCISVTCIPHSRTCFPDSKLIPFTVLFCFVSFCIFYISLSITWSLKSKMFSFWLTIQLYQVLTEDRLKEAQEEKTGEIDDTNNNTPRMEAQRGHLIPRDWSFRCLWTTCGCRESSPSPPEEQTVF